MAEGLNFSRRLRRTPYTTSAEKAGVTGFSVVNHMLLPKAYGRSVEDDYWHLREHGECFKLGGSVVVVSFSNVTGNGDLNWSLCLMGDDGSGGLQRFDVLSLGSI